MAAFLSQEILKVKVEGDFACFTRSDLKVERMSYPCMTPAAARGVLDSILWKPEFKWYIRRILVLRPVSYFSVKRNEINKKQGTTPFNADEVKNRTQRTSIILKDVAYIIEASVYQDSFDDKNRPLKYEEIFRRRVRKGQCFRRPYLGTREFACEFTEPTPEDTPIQETFPIGSLFYDMFYNEKGKPQPLFAYDMAIRNGILDCESASNEEGTLNKLLMSSSHLRPPLNDGIKELLSFYREQEEKENPNA